MSHETTYIIEQVDGKIQICLDILIDFDQVKINGTGSAFDVVFDNLNASIAEASAMNSEFLTQ